MIDITTCKKMINMKLDGNTWLIELLVLDKYTWNYLTLCKQMIDIK